MTYLLIFAIIGIYEKIMTQDTVHTEDTKPYHFTFEIDIDCQELLDAIGLEYKQSQEDYSQNVVCVDLTPAEYKESIYDLALGSCNEQTLASYILNPELSEYTTKCSIYTPYGDTICFT